MMRVGMSLLLHSYRSRFLSFSTRCRHDSNHVKIVEVGPRDGLQAEPLSLTLDQRFGLIRHLSKTGLTCIEVGSLVSPKWVPQMAESEKLYEKVSKEIGITKPELQFPMLVPNQRGWDIAYNAHVKEIALFTAASETFSKKNTNCSIEESLDRFEPIVHAAREKGVWVRGYISCVLGCPYEGGKPTTELSKKTIEIAQRMLLDLRVDEISLGDTIGTGTPEHMRQLLKDLFMALKGTDSNENMSESFSHQVAVHCHDTYGQALANIWVALEEGIRIIDASIGGLGGCPYASGASGNIATEDVLYMLKGSGMKTGVDIDMMIKANEYIMPLLKKSPGGMSKVARALLSKRSKTL
jgi:hydroxymethylglutaryl-CoA lyase